MLAKLKMTKVWCVAWYPCNSESGRITPQRWCACHSQKSPRYHDTMATKCGMFVPLPIGVEFREPTCPECMAICKER